jgi:hypothetical protein
MPTVVAAAVLQTVWSVGATAGPSGEPTLLVQRATTDSPDAHTSTHVSSGDLLGVSRDAPSHLGVQREDRRIASVHAGRTGVRLSSRDGGQNEPLLCLHDVPIVGRLCTVQVNPPHGLPAGAGAERPSTASTPGPRQPW